MDLQLSQNKKLKEKKKKPFSITSNSSPMAIVKDPLVWHKEFSLTHPTFRQLVLRANIYWAQLHGRHHSKQFICVISFNLQQSNQSGSMVNAILFINH